MLIPKAIDKIRRTILRSFSTLTGSLSVMIVTFAIFACNTKIAVPEQTKYTANTAVPSKIQGIGICRSALMIICTILIPKVIMPIVPHRKLKVDTSTACTLRSMYALLKPSFRLANIQSTDSFIRSNNPAGRNPSSSNSTCTSATLSMKGVKSIS